MRHAILTVVSTKIKICSDVMAHSLVDEYQCFSLVDEYQCFKENCCLLLQGIKLYRHIPKDHDFNQGMSLPHSLILLGLATLLPHLAIIPKIQEKEINIQGTISEILEAVDAVCCSR
jgi:hypothetical protein